MRLTAVTGEKKETVIPFMLTSDIPSGVQFSGFKAGRKFIHIVIRSYMHFSLSLIKSLTRASNFILSFLSSVHSLLFHGLLFRSVSLSLVPSFSRLCSDSHPCLTFQLVCFAASPSSIMCAGQGKKSPYPQDGIRY